MQEPEIIAPLAIALFTGSAFAEGNQDFAAFALKQAQRADFNGCNAGIREAFEDATGRDMRVWTDLMQETKGDQLQIIGVWGSEGDTVTRDVTVRRAGKTCLTHLSTRFVLNKSCRAFLSETLDLKVNSVTGDVLGGELGRGATAPLHQAGNYCLVEFRRRSTDQTN